MTHIHLHEGDLPEGLDFGPELAVDTETMGLDLRRDRLCLIQLRGRDTDVHLVRFAPGGYDASRLKALLADPGTLKLYHYARFDLASIQAYLGVTAAPVFCSKIASKLVRTFSGGHGLKDLTRDLLGVELDKQKQCSDWGQTELDSAQRQYAANDVLYLHELKDKLEALLIREGRLELAQACWDFLPMRARIDLAGWNDIDIFAH